MSVETIWNQLLRRKPDTVSKRLAWRVMRQFATEHAIEVEFGLLPRWTWSPPMLPAGTSVDLAYKLLLANVKYRCEAVLLLPTGPTGTQQPRSTACVSTQPGCGVGCPFCATATLGYRGNLTAHEILEQVYWAGRAAMLRGRSLRNVVFMGMGEPLHNLDAVLESLDWLTSAAGFGFSPRRITVSTAGVPSAMQRLAREFPRVRLALSLHSADAALRRKLVPRATGDLEQLRDTIGRLNQLQTDPVWIEIVLLDGINDRLADARRLANFCVGLRVEVNLIPYNSTVVAEQFAATPRAQREAFAGVLRQAGIRTTIRTSFGSTSDAACGQLVAPKSGD